MNTQIPVKSQNLASRALGDYTVVIDLSEERMFHELNETAAFIWRLCDGYRTVAEIAAFVREEYEGENLAEEVRACLSDFERLRLVSFS